jgi:hypothetical protein
VKDPDRGARIAVRIYEARDAVRALWGDAYQARIVEYREMVRAAMAKYGCNEVEAPLLIIRGARELQVHMDGLTNAALMAAAVDEFEARGRPSRAS